MVGRVRVPNRIILSFVFARLATACWSVGLEFEGDPKRIYRAVNITSKTPAGINICNRRLWFTPFSLTGALKSAGSGPLCFLFMTIQPWCNAVRQYTRWCSIFTPAGGIARWQKLPSEGNARVVFGSSDNPRNGQIDSCINLTL